MLISYWLISNDHQQQQTKIQQQTFRLISNKHNVNKLLYEHIQSNFTSDHFSYRAPHPQAFLAH